MTIHIEAISSFNGALLFRARKPYMRDWRDRDRDASMGPYSFEQGNIKGRPATPRRRNASMGPYSFEQGNL